MKALLQRVSEASVTIDGDCVGAIQRGYLVLLGITESDTQDTSQELCDKIIHLRLFENEEGKFDKSLDDIQGDLLIVSQFTLYGNTQKGRRPSFVEAAHPDIAEPLYDAFVKAASSLCKGTVATGKFGANMQISLVNDGPVTLLLEK